MGHSLKLLAQSGVGQIGAVMAPEGLREGDSFDLTERITIIGRAPLNDIILDDPSVSRRHASIRLDYRGCWIADLESRSGTFVNGKRLSDESRKLRDSDRIEFGRTSQTQLVFVEAETKTDAPRLIVSITASSDLA